ncbi:MAG: cytochrome P450 [Pseudomonadales bacterium]
MEPAQVDLSDVNIQKRPWQAYQLLRDEAPVYRMPDTGMYTITRYEDICNIVRDPKRFSMRANRDFLFKTDAAKQYYVDHGLPRHTPLSTDPPYHTEFRGHLEPFFSAGRIRQWEPELRKLIEQLANSLETSETIDFVEAFCMPLPMSVMTVLLGLPLADHKLLKHWTDVWVLPFSHGMTPEQEMYVAKEGVKFQRYLEDALERKRREPQEDLLTLLVQTRREDGSELTRKEMIGFAEQAVVGANETTQNALAMALCAMIEAPGTEQRLRNEPKKIKNFIEECLRLHSPTAGMYRWTTEDVEMHGVLIPKGSVVHLRFAAANRDERHFAEPETLDLDRKKAGSHLAFSHAIHHCLGAPLARLELNLSLEILLSRRQNFRFGRAADSYEFVPGLALRQMAYLWIQSDSVDAVAVSTA